jgi:hypothetical protein
MAPASSGARWHGRASYLKGNRIIAQRMYCHGHEVMLRVAITPITPAGRRLPAGRAAAPSLASEMSDGTAPRLPQAGRTLADLLPSAWRTGGRALERAG